MIDRTQITGLILAGGLSRRMSTASVAADKGLEQFRGRPLITHVIERLAPQVGHLIINANRHQSLYERFALPVITDAMPDFAGPVAGLSAGLHRCATPWLVTAPCDAPFLPADLVARLMDGALRANAPLAIARAAGRDQPVFELVARSLLAHVDAYLSTGRRRMDGWYTDLPAAFVEFDDVQAFVNINTRDELAHLAADTP